MPATTARPRKRTRRARKARTAAAAESSSSSSSESSSSSDSSSDSDSDDSSTPSVKAKGKARAQDVIDAAMSVDSDSDSDSSSASSSSSSSSKTSVSPLKQTRTRKTSPLPTFNDASLLLQHERSTLRPLPNVDDLVTSTSQDLSLASPVQAYLRRKMLRDSGSKREENLTQPREDPTQRQEFEQFWLSAVTAELGDELDALRRREPNLTLADHPDSRLPLLIDALSAGADLFKTHRGGAGQVDEIDIVLKERERLVAQQSQS